MAADLNTSAGRKAWTPTPEPEGVGTWVPHYDSQGRALRAYFIPLEVRCPECEGQGHPRPTRRRR